MKSRPDTAEAQVEQRTYLKSRASGKGRRDSNILQIRRKTRGKAVIDASALLRLLLDGDCRFSEIVEQGNAFHGSTMVQRSDTCRRLIDASFMRWRRILREDDELVRILRGCH